jgi:hypothetical protein
LRRLWALALVPVLVPLARAGPDANAPEFNVAAFSHAQAAGRLPPEWHELRFRNGVKPTVYTLVQDGAQVVLKASAQASASGLIHELNVDPLVYPRLQWRWKVPQVLRASDPARKSGDDYPARIYVTFTKRAADRTLRDRLLRLFYGREIPDAAINYVWDTHTAVGTILPNAYTSRVQMIVVESGPAKLHQWVSEERNLYADYQQAFGGRPASISGIALMTDTDDTGESAEAYYGDIRLLGMPGAR